MQIVTNAEKITRKELKKIAQRSFGDLVKAVVDVSQEIMLIDAELHADQEAELLEKGSHQKDLWGINLYPEFSTLEDLIEFDSMINLRPSQGNRSRGVEDSKLREKIVTIVSNLITEE